MNTVWTLVGIALLIAVYWRICYAIGCWWQDLGRK